MSVERDEFARYLAEKPDAKSYDTHSVMVILFLIMQRDIRDRYLCRGSLAGARTCLCGMCRKV
jgi:hypothetical protein